MSLRRAILQHSKALPHSFLYYSIPISYSCSLSLKFSNAGTNCHSYAEGLQSLEFPVCSDSLLFWIQQLLSGCGGMEGSLGSQACWYFCVHCITTHSKDLIFLNGCTTVLAWITPRDWLVKFSSRLLQVPQTHPGLSLLSKYRILHQEDKKA